jgi:hypothetical protein
MNIFRKSPRTVQPPKAPELLLHPPYWLLWVPGNPQPGGPPLEIIAVAPMMVPKEIVSDNAYTLCALSYKCHTEKNSRLVFVNDITFLLSDAGSSWAAWNVDWEAAIVELQRCEIPRMYIEANEITSTLAINAGRPHIMMQFLHDGTQRLATREEREGFRASVVTVLERDWAPYIERQVRGGYIHGV